MPKRISIVETSDPLMDSVVFITLRVYGRMTLNVSTDSLLAVFEYRYEVLDQRLSDPGFFGKI
jgi:hypothetical protein